MSDSVKLLREGKFCAELKFPEDRFRKLFPTDDDAIADMERWWKRYKGIALAKRIQMPPILSVSRRTFGFDFRESQL